MTRPARRFGGWENVRMIRRAFKAGDVTDLLCALQYVRGTLESLQRDGQDVDVSLAVVRDAINRGKRGRDRDGGKPKAD